jgi:chorismate mutase
MNKKMQGELESLRLKIDEIDKKIIKLFGERQQTSVKIGHIKKELDLPVIDFDRKIRVFEQALDLGKLENLKESDVRDLIEFLHEKSVRAQKSGL